MTLDERSLPSPESQRTERAADETPNWGLKEVTRPAVCQIGPPRGVGEAKRPHPPLRAPFSGRDLMPHDGPPGLAGWRAGGRG